MDTSKTNEKNGAASAALKRCTRCGRSLDALSGFYAGSAWCADCCRQYKRSRYAETRKVPDGVRYDRRDGRCYEHRGYSRRISWSAPMEEKMRRLFPSTLNADLADILGVSVRTLVRKAREMGLEKDPRWLRSVWDKRRSLAQLVNRTVGNKGQFRKGHRASPATEFKPGHRCARKKAGL